MDKKLIYGVDRTKNRQSTCKGCKQFIEKKVLRLIYYQQSRNFDGPEQKFYHPNCFFQKFHPRSQFDINGFATLDNDDQDELKKLLDATKANSRKRVKPSESDVASASSSGNENNEPASKKRKPDVQGTHDALDKSIRRQNEELHELREQINEFIGKEGRKFLLQHNQQYVPRNQKEILDHITDVVYFGAIEPCTVSECNGGKFVFDGNTTYRCTGLLSAFGDCNKKVNKPERRPVKIPADYAEFVFLYRDFNAQQHRIFKETPKAKTMARAKAAKQSERPAQGPITRNRKMLVKDKAIVDPGSRLQDVAHVFIADEKLYSVALDHVELSAHTDKNSYYKLQLLESDGEDPQRYWVYRSWGRINTKIGNDKLEPFNEKSEAIANFEKVYQQKTRNHFNAKSFFKCPKKYFEVPHSSKPIEKPYKLVDSKILHASVQHLLKLLLNEEIMSGVMVKFNLDLNKMPLGKVRRKQITDAFQILKEIQSKIKNNASNELLTECSNRFHSIIPHKACFRDTLVSKEDLANKAQMLKDLNTIQISYEFVYKSGERGRNILDDFYTKLNSVIEPLNDDSKPFQMIKEAFDSTKSINDCQIEQIFKIQRKKEGENRANGCEMFDGLNDHRLLWHGSRITNINQILVHGLKIAPAEHTTAIGCKLGKGLYFSDAVANSIEYCYASQSNNIGVLLLYEVALGNTVKSVDPDSIDELPDGHHSVQGVGKISPKSSKCIDNVIIYSGPLKEDNAIESAFDYNEFVVYNNKQVQLKYLVQFKLFKYTERFSGTYAIQ